MVHTEKVHVMFGVLAALGGAGALWATWRPRSWLRFAWPVLALVVGVFLLVPVEGHTLTYTDTGWWETIVSAIPSDRAGWIGDWFRTLSVTHVLQHKLGAASILGLAGIELLRARGGLQGRPWGLALPVLLVTCGLAFGLHGGTTAHLPSRAELVHHWVFGVAFVAGGATLGMARRGILRHRAWHGVWAALVLLVGLDIALRYRLDRVPTSTEIHSHESPGPGKR